MTNWPPDPARLRRPAYLSLAGQIADAIKDGTLSNGTQLPPQRKLADDLNLSVQTVSRAYTELVRQGFLSGEIGRGSFVQSVPGDHAPPYLPERHGNLIDLSVLKPIGDQIHVDRMRQAFAWLGENLPASAILSFRPATVYPRHKEIAASWLALCGLSVPAFNITITNGATAAITTALMSVAPPGSTIAAETLSHHTLTPLSAYLGLQLKGIATDAQGMIPDALEDACRHSQIRAVFLQPSAINPRAIVASDLRRRELAAVAERHDLAIIENDVLGPLVDRNAGPVAAHAPERTLYITGFSKITAPGLRIGYLSAPERFAAAVANRHLVTNWMATPAMAEIASRWVTDGTAMELVTWQRDHLVARHAIADEALAGLTYFSHPQSLHVWLPLEAGQSETDFVTQARLRGVAVAAGGSFRTGKTDTGQAVRLSLGSTTPTDLKTGLSVISALARAQAAEDLLPL